MKNRSPLVILSIVAILALAACSTAATQQTVSTADLQTLVALSIAQTQLAGTVTAVAQNGSSTAINPTPPAMSLAEATSTPTLTPAALTSATPEGVWLDINQNTNCRIGPTSSFAVVNVMEKGRHLQAVGRSTINGYYYVINPALTNSFCWIWNQYATISGDTSSLPVYTPQSSPTPTLTPTPIADLAVSYIGVTACGTDYSLRLNVVNTGSTTWRSVKMIVTDNTTSTVFTHSADLFYGYNGCTSDATQADLTQGESSYLSNYAPGQLTYNPAGHSLTVTLIVYSADGLTGTSITKTLTVNP
jgi:hypothetical protein